LLHTKRTAANGKWCLVKIRGDVCVLTGYSSWQKASNCSNYDLLQVAERDLIKQLALYKKKKLWLDECPGVEPRALESSWLIASATCGEIILPEGFHEW
jgi:hypothetical protein